MIQSGYLLMFSDSVTSSEECAGAKASDCNLQASIAASQPYCPPLLALSQYIYIYRQKRAFMHESFAKKGIVLLHCGYLSQLPVDI